MRISQSLAIEIAQKLTEKKKEVITKLEKEFQESVTKMYKSDLPPSILKAFANSETKPFIYTTSCVRIEGHGFNYRMASLSSNLPSIVGGTPKLDLTPERGKILFALETKIDKARAEYNTLLQETENALLSLRTFKNIQENLPEAVPYLPKSNTTALIPNLEGLRKKLKAA